MKKTYPGAQCVVYKLYMYVGPHLLLANMKGGSPFPRREQRRGSTTRAGCWTGTVLDIETIFFLFATFDFTRPGLFCLFTKGECNEIMRIISVHKAWVFTWMCRNLDR
jgi:hypothetical protein